jgi:hypothetical protein
MVIVCTVAPLLTVGTDLCSPAASDGERLKLVDVVKRIEDRMAVLNVMDVFERSLPLARHAAEGRSWAAWPRRWKITAMDHASEARTATPSESVSDVEVDRASGHPVLRFTLQYHERNAAAWRPVTIGGLSAGRFTNPLLTR